MTDSTRLVNLDADPSAVIRLSLTAMRVAAQGTSKSAAAAQAAMKAYDEQIASGLSVEDASLAARRILHASLTGLQGGP